MAEDIYNQIAEKLTSVSKKNKHTDGFLVEVEKKFAQMLLHEEEMAKQLTETAKIQSEIPQKINVLTQTALPAIKEAANKLAAKQNELKSALENSCWTQNTLLSEMEQLLSQYLDTDPKQKEGYKKVDKEIFHSMVVMNSTDSSLRECTETFEKELAELKTTISGIEIFLRKEIVKQIVDNFSEVVKKRKVQAKPADK